MHEHTHCRILRSIGDVDAVRADWKCLWQRDPRATPFQSPEWLLPWWQHFAGSDKELRVALVYDRDTLLAIFPFYLDRNPRSGEPSLRLLGAGTSDYLDGIFSPAATVEHVFAAMEELAQYDAEWHNIQLSQLPPGSVLMEALGEIGHCGQYASENCTQLSAVPLAALPKKIRRNLNYYRNQAQRRGRIEFAMAESAGWRDAFDALVRFHTSRWETRGLPGVLCDEAVVAWHYNAIPELVRGGLAQLMLLRLNGEVIAVLYSLFDYAERRSRKAYFYLTGFDPEYAGISPGSLLLGFGIAYAAEHGIDTVDFLRGREDYKQLWHVRTTPTFGFIVPRDSVLMEALAEGYGRLR